MEVFFVDGSSGGAASAPSARLVTGATDTIESTDFQNAIDYSFAGAVAVTLPDLSAGFPVGKLVTVVLVAMNNLTALTITPAVGVQINNSASAWVPTSGPGVWSLSSPDGITWFHT